jgi:hypothetical protein
MVEPTAAVTPPPGVTLQEQLDLIIDDIDDEIAGRYVFTLRDLLENPMDYVDSPNVLREIDAVKRDLDDYFERRKSEVAPQTARFKEDAMKSSRVADKLDEVIKSVTKELKKPLVIPLVFIRKEDDEEVIFIDRFEPTYNDLISELAKNSMFVADLSIKFEDFKVGRWIFVGSSKNRAIFVSFPVNPAGVLDLAKDQLNIALDSVRTDLEIASLPAAEEEKPAKAKK